MKITALRTLAVLAVSLATAAPGRAQAPAGVPASAVLRADQPGPVVNKNVYGHFAEHLGRGIYEGIWVKPDSPIPNTRGIRNDVVAALKDLSIPVLRWPGGCFATTARPYSTALMARWASMRSSSRPWKAPCGPMWATGSSGACRASSTRASRTSSRSPTR